MIDDGNVVNCQSTKKTREILETAQASIPTSRSVALGSKIVFLAITAKRISLKLTKFKPTLKEIFRVFGDCYGGYFDVRNGKHILT
jgi:hypothetical protein